MHANPILNTAGEIMKAGCVVLNERGELLLVINEHRDTWGLPKGHAEIGETAEEVAIRETREETGYQVELIRPVGDMTYVNAHTDQPVRVHYYLAKTVSHHDEAEETWGWYSLEKAKTMVRSNMKEFLEAALA